MSQLLHLKGVVLSHMPEAKPNIRQAVIGFINALDGAIEEAGGLDNNDDLDMAIKTLDAALCDVDVQEMTTSPTLADDEEVNLLEGLNEDDDKQT